MLSIKNRKKILGWGWITLCFAVLSHQLAAQPTVRGRVTDAIEGEPLIGATIVQKGTTNGTVSDDSGEFSISVPANATLIFSYIGYLSKEVQIGNQTTVDVALEEDLKSLEGVVVVGYGTQKKSDLTGAVGTISGKELLSIPSPSFDQMMQGKIAGTQITQTTGAPGGNVNIVIRGVSSITGGNQPLYVIDGFAMGAGGSGSDVSSFNGNSFSSGGMAQNTASKINPLTNINPADIESIEILKDASATAIYGSRGANGVVIITTKRGKQGQSKINFDASNGVQMIANKLDMLNARQFAEFVADGRDNAWVLSGGNASDPNEVRSAGTRVKPEFRNPEAITVNTNWQDVIFRPSVVQSYQLSASGGKEGVDYYVSGGYFNQEGIIKGSDFKKFNLRSNIDAYLTKRLKLGISIAGSHSWGKFARAEGHLGQRGLISAALASSPALSVYDKNGNYTSELLDPLGVPVENPLLIIDEFSDTRSSTNVFTNNYLEYEIVEGLTLKSSIGINYIADHTRLWKSSEIGEWGAKTSLATAGVHQRTNLNWLNENVLNYRRSINGVHDVDAIVGFTAQKDKTDWLQAGATDFPTDHIEYLAGGNVNAGTNYVSEWSMLSLLARVNYTYKGKYLVTGTVRRDGSSRFGPNNRWGTFPSFSVGYRISEEPFMQSVTFIDNLKIRASYGVSGNNLIGNYAHIGLLGTTRYVSSNQAALGIIPQSLANENLTWERSLQTNIGLDVALFDNRLTLSVDAYKNHKKDLLLNASLPAISGFSASTQNIGELENKGLEFTLDAVVVNTGNFSWNSNFNIGVNKNKVLVLNSDNARIENSAYQFTEVGRPISSFYMLHAIGVFQDWDDVDAHPKQHPDVQPGDLKFEDVNGDGVITNDDKTFVGDPWPDYTFGFNNRLEYDNFALSISVTGSQGNDVYFQGGEIILNAAGVQNQLAVTDERWKSLDDPGNGFTPRAIRSDYAKGISSNSRYLFDGSYVRIKNINLSYTFQRQTLEKINLSGLSVYGDISNVYTFTDYPGYDPEASSTGDNIAASGIDYFSYPIPRIFTLGLRVSF
ncbi:TonB-linked outer membrane protein, SusC/RagA family [Echinicola vietnamensis DSM 17526]|uniref:TonB-linked outer membrane protein, SusC/RagA family n=1 Tax=Echinicola vietnamensis (strain DSM 17526 / LMG 23754 / KMM 6221) TaxID=926556 RepID=L0FVJ7_ECHVK|nr:TonB-linked outer membrane protein, SusC/RagA family [Echinicola vietnamensis DSM 17526]